MSLRTVFAVLVIAPFLAQCGGGDILRTASSGPVSTTTSEAVQAAALISRYRVSQGLSPVSVDGRLNQAAAVQARAVAEAGHLSHGAFASRMATFGIRGTAAENLTAGSGTVADAVARWQASPAHNVNLLLPEGRRIGLARADTPGAGYGRYWALVIAQ